MDKAIKKPQTLVQTYKTEKWIAGILFPCSITYLINFLAVVSKVSSLFKYANIYIPFLFSEFPTLSEKCISDIVTSW